MARDLGMTLVGTAAWHEAREAGGLLSPDVVGASKSLEACSLAYALPDPAMTHKFPSS